MSSIGKASRSLNIFFSRWRVKGRATGRVSVRGADLHSVAAVLRALSSRAATSLYPYLGLGGLGVL